MRTLREVAVVAARIRWIRVGLLVSRKKVVVTLSESLIDWMKKAEAVSVGVGVACPNCQHDRHPSDCEARTYGGGWCGCPSIEPSAKQRSVFIASCSPERVLALLNVAREVNRRADDGSPQWVRDAAAQLARYLGAEKRL